MVIKFLSLNLWHGNLIEHCADFLEGEDADVVILQEVHNGTDKNLPEPLRSLEILQDKLKYPYYDYAPALSVVRPEGKVSQGNAILSGFKISNSDSSFLYGRFEDSYHDIPENYHKEPRVLQHAALDTPIGEVNVFNFHGVWDLDGNNYSEQRREMSEKTIDAIKGKPNVLLGGDTNAQPTNQAIKDIEQHLRSVFGTTLKTTFNMGRKDNPGYATAAVDMMFVSPNIKILERNCPDVDVSDHLPVVARLDIS